MITIKNNSCGVKKNNTYGLIKVIGKPFSIGKYYLVVVKCNDCKSILTMHTQKLGGKTPPSRCSNCANSMGTHGETKTRLYKIWDGMKSRCLRKTDSNYFNYGGRGITICEEWKCSFENFRDWSISNGYTPDLELDRRKNNKGYSPGNCRWVTRKVNMNNRRNTINLTAFGETKCITSWAEDKRCKIKLTTLETRIRRKWDHKKAIITPARKLVEKV